MQTKQVIVLALVGLICSAGFALASPTTPKLFGFMDAVCDACKVVGKQVQENLPQMKGQFEQICGLLGSADLTKMCLDKCHEAESKIENETPEEICKQLGVCQ